MRRGALVLAVIVLAAGLAPASAISPPCVPGTRTCLPACIPGTDICLFEEPSTCEIGCSLTIVITGYEVSRGPGAVLVTVDVAGKLAGAAPGAVVSGEVTITAPNPCWPDASACVDVIDVQTNEFTSAVAEDGSYAAAAGPFTYSSDGTGPACWTVHVDAEARHGTSSAADEDDPELCG